MSFPMPPATMPPPRKKRLTPDQEQMLMAQGMNPDTYDGMPADVVFPGSVPPQPAPAPMPMQAMPPQQAASPPGNAFDYGTGGYGGAIGMPPQEMAIAEEPDPFASPIYDPYFAATDAFAPEEDDPFNPNPMGDALADPFTAQPARSPVSVPGGASVGGTPLKSSPSASMGKASSGDSRYPPGRIGRRMASRATSRRRR